MHKILLLAVVVSVLGLSGYLFFSQKSAQRVQGTKVAVLKKGQDMSSVPIEAPSNLIETSSAQGSYLCTYSHHKDSACTQPSQFIPQPYTKIETSNKSKACSFGYNDYWKVSCTLITESTCITPGQCQAGGIGCCTGDAPISQSSCYHSNYACPALPGEPGTSSQRIRIQGKVVNCAGQPLSGVKVSMFADTTKSVLNSAYTDALGNYRITKGYKDSDGVRKFALMAGKDVDANSANYFGRTGAPAFVSPYNVTYNCGVVNCNYRQNQAQGGPYRENYHVGHNWTQVQYKARVVHGTTTTTGFDFKQVNCQ